MIRLKIPGGLGTRPYKIILKETVFKISFKHVDQPKF
jgi:hypothetical protein